MDQANYVGKVLWKGALFLFQDGDSNATGRQQGQSDETKTITRGDGDNNAE